MRDERARLVPPPPFTVTCASCQVSHVSTEATLPEGWMIITAGVRCPDCAPPARKAVSNG
ncbi:hypothetical protein [Sphingomonas bisphenolicum]